MSYFIIYALTGFLVFFIYNATGKIDLHAPRQRQGIRAGNAFIIAILWPVVIIALEWDRLLEIKQRIDGRRTRKLDNLLYDLLRKPKSKSQKINNLLVKLISRNRDATYKSDTSSCITFWVERNKSSNDVFQVHQSEWKIKTGLWGMDSFRKSIHDQEVADQSDKEITLGDRLDRNRVLLRRGSPGGEPWSGIFTREFKKSISKLDKKVKGRIVEAIMEICESPVEVRGDTQKPLAGELDGHWRYRIGDYRLIYLPMIDHHKIVFYDFDTRGQVYY